jgi:phosphatidylglycerol:prolipoprotein diacylglycerol transferase
MFTIPGWAFKVIVPLLILWGCYSIVVSVNRSSPAAKKDGEGEGAKGFQLPADSPFNAVISVAIGLGVFAFASPVVVEGAGAARLVSLLKGFAHGPHWRAPWESLPIYSYGVMLGLSLVVGWYIVLGLMRRQCPETERKRYEEFMRDMADCYVATAFAAVAGSRVLYILTNLSEFPTLWSMLKLRSGGLVAYGGFLGGLLGSIVFLRVKGYRLWPWADATVASLGTGVMITRLGCYMYGCDFGRALPPTAPGFLKTLGSFPHWHDNHGAPAWQQHVSMGFRATEQSCARDYHGVWSATERVCKLPFSAQHSAPVHPTQLYESLLGFSIFLTLMWMWRRRKFEGQIFLSFGMLYGIGRSLLEIIRDDAERGTVGGLSTSQFIGITTTLICVPLYLYLQKNGRAAGPINLFAPAPAIVDDPPKGGAEKPAGEKTATAKPAESKDSSK